MVLWYHNDTFMCFFDLFSLVIDKCQDSDQYMADKQWFA